MTLQLQQSKDVLTRRYRNSEKLVGIIDATQDIAQEKIVDQACYLKDQCTILATGIWLDLLARRFGLERPSKPTATAFYFGFAGNSQAATFNQAPFRPNDLSSNTVPVGDSVFKQLLFAAIGSLRTNGQQDNINEIIQSSYPGSFAVDNLDMTMTVYLNLDLLDDDLDVIVQQDGNIPKPAGVGIIVETIEFFGFDGSGVGFDQEQFQYGS